MKIGRPAFLFLLAAAVGPPGCAVQDEAWKGAASPRVVVTIPPLASFVKGVGGEHVTVHSLCTNQGPHQYDYSVSDLRYFRRADLFFANGLTLDEAFADRLDKNSGNARLRYVKLGDRLPRDLLLKG